MPSVLSWNINGLKAKLQSKTVECKIVNKKIVECKTVKSKTVKPKTVDGKTALLKIFDQYDIVLLQETHIGQMDNGKDDDWKTITKALKYKYDLVKLENYEEEEDEEEEKEEKKKPTMYMTYFSSNRKGVAILINKPHTLLNSFSKGGDFAWVHVEIDGQEYTFVSVYYRGLGPNVIGNLMLEIFYSFSIDGSDAFKCRPVIGGDFNTTLDPKLDANIFIKEHTERRETLKAFLKIVKVSDVWRKMHGEDRKYTYRDKKRKITESRLDYVFMLEDEVQYVDSCEILEKIALSDHSPVSLTLNYTGIQQPREE